ncbi:MAG: hypothetical protein ABI430_00280 [Candidatus Taylorbacteria bacterium]
MAFFNLTKSTTRDNVKFVLLVRKHQPNNPGSIKRDQLTNGNGGIMTDNKVTVNAECRDCGGTGIYSSSAALPTGSGIICKDCGGSGKRVISFTSFTHRKERTDIQTVFLERCGSAAITYSEFLVRPTLAT